MNTIIAALLLVPMAFAARAAPEPSPAAENTTTTTTSTNLLPRAAAGATDAQPHPPLPGDACIDEGDWYCTADTANYQRCASGQWTAVLPVARGTQCAPVGFSHNGTDNPPYFSIGDGGSGSGPGPGPGSAAALTLTTTLPASVTTITRTSTVPAAAGPSEAVITIITTVPASTTRIVLTVDIPAHSGSGSSSSAAATVTQSAGAPKADVSGDVRRRGNGWCVLLQVAGIVAVHLLG